MTLITKIYNALSPDLAKPKYRDNNCRVAGTCYVASEALYHLSGGRKSNLKPCRVKHEGSMHWYLKDDTGNIIDVTVEQFKTTPNYKAGIGCGFLTKKPSKRAKILMDRIMKNKLIKRGAYD